MVSKRVHDLNCGSVESSGNLDLRWSHMSMGTIKLGPVTNDGCG